MAARGLYADGLSPWSLLCWRYLLALVIILAGIRLARLCLRAAMRQGTWQIALVGVSLGAIQTLCYSRVCAGSTPVSRCCCLYLPGGDSWRRKRHFTLRVMVPRDLRGKV
jgi:hypothetical protein